MDRPTSTQALASLHAPIPGLVCAFRFGSDGVAASLPADGSIDGAGAGEGWIWLHFSLADQRARNWLASAPGLSDTARDLLLADDTHLQLHAREDCMFGVLADRVLDFAAEVGADQIGDLRFALTRELVITARNKPLRSIEAVKQAIRGGTPLETPTAFLESVIDSMAEEIVAAKDVAADGVDEVEDDVLADDLHDERVALGRLRRQIAALQRRVSGLHALFQRLDLRRAGPALSLPVQAAVERIVQLLAALEHEVRDVQERGRLLQEELTAQLATATNRHLHALSILTAVLLPPSVVVGFFGMNTKDLPLAGTAGGAFWAMGLCALSGVVVYILLRKAPALLRRAGIVD